MILVGTTAFHVQGGLIWTLCLSFVEFVFFEFIETKRPHGEIYYSCHMLEALYLRGWWDGLAISYMRCNLMFMPMLTSLDALGPGDLLLEPKFTVRVPILVLFCLREVSGSRLGSLYS